MTFENDPKPSFLQSEKRSLLSKEGWHEALRQEVELAETTDKPLSILFMDIDNLKSLNDTFGHPEGDEVIKSAGDALLVIAQNFRLKTEAKGDRSPDLISFSHPETSDEKLQPARIGGDEFAAICHTDEQGIEAIILRIRRVFNTKLNENQKNAGIAISIGASTHKKGMSASAMLTEADQNLYKEKLARLKDLSIEEQIALSGIVSQLKGMSISPRDLSKYCIRYNIPQ